MLAGRGGDRRLALDRGARRAGPVPVLQGLPVGLPGRTSTWRRTRRSSPPPLRAAGRGRGRCRTGRWAGCRCGRGSRRTRAAAGQRGWRAGCRLAKRLGGIAPEREIPAFAEQTFTVVVRRPRRHGLRRRGTGRAVAGHLHQPPGARGRPGGGRGAGGGRVSRWCCRPGPVCCGLTWISTGQLRRGQDGASTRRCDAWRRTWTPARRSSGWSRAAPRRSAHDAPELLPDDPLAAAARRVDAHLRRVPGRPRPAGSRRAVGRDGAGPDPLPPARRPRLRRRPRADGRGGHRRGRSRLRLLRPGRQLRLRTRPLRGLEGGRRERVLLPAVRAAAPDTADPRRRLQLPHPDPPRHRRRAGAPGPGARRRAASRTTEGSAQPSSRRAVSA